jgi:glycosyltransferase involved in cell wall biosynthesis
VTAKVLIIVENLPVPFDRRVWMEATTLRDAGYVVSVICPIGKGYEALYEVIDGIHVYRHALPPEANSPVGYLREYAGALWAEWRLARRVWRERGFEVIHACNPPDLIFLVGAWFKLLHGTKFIFDHHDLNPELYESKFEGRHDFFTRCSSWPSASRSPRLTRSSAPTNRTGPLRLRADTRGPSRFMLFAVRLTS